MIIWLWLDFLLENEMKEFNHDDTVVVSGKDLNRIIVLIRALMDLKPDLNARLMDFYCYLNELKPIEKSLDEIIWEEGMTCPSWDSFDCDEDDLTRLN